MPEINISVETLAEAIKNLNSEDLETLSILIGGDGKELLKRKKEVEKKKVKLLSREDAFNV